MPKVLVILIHPKFETSKANQILWDAIPESKEITKHDLYETYPDFFIDIKKEQSLLLDHDYVMFQHPFYWYSCPPLMKQWIDDVLEEGWAYGKTGNQLVGKTWIQCITTGGQDTAYSKEGFHKHTVNDFLLPFRRTAELCGMIYRDPFLVQGTFQLGEKQLAEFSNSFRKFIFSILESSHA
ncbi:MAG: NAD(P)H-dependent oxidoreductase [Leptospira sp.]|nr:NAD(P)H-dependent oxidoreductase [Leptospira sp.]